MKALGCLRILTELAAHADVIEKYPCYPTALDRQRLPAGDLGAQARGGCCPKRRLAQCRKCQKAVEKNVWTSRADWEFDEHEQCTDPSAEALRSALGIRDVRKTTKPDFS